MNRRALFLALPVTAVLRGIRGGQGRVWRAFTGKPVHVEALPVLEFHPWMFMDHESGEIKAEVIRDLLRTEVVK